MSEPFWQPRDDNGACLLGAGFFLAGSGVLAWQILGTLRQADEGAPTLTYSLPLILMGVMFVTLGGLWLVRGLAGYVWARSFHRDPRAPDPDDHRLRAGRGHDGADELAPRAARLRGLTHDD
ncbi:MAG: hypothetical protein EXS08_14795 [Planctomycetes bacterium]|nr:hypothetical protein [Planctomycetota bacterium]